MVTFRLTHQAKAIQLVKILLFYRYLIEMNRYYQQLNEDQLESDPIPEIPPNPKPASGVSTENLEKHDLEPSLFSRSCTSDLTSLAANSRQVGFYYQRARYYNPDIGRFTQQDAWEGTRYDPITLHKYLYANIDPVNRIDPSGKFTVAEMLITAFTIGLVASIVAGSYYRAMGSSVTNLRKSMLTWFFIGAGAGALIYSGAWLFSWLTATSVATTAGLSAGAIEKILSNQQRLQHAWDRHWSDILKCWQDLKPIVEKVLSNPQVTQNGIKLKDGSIINTFAAKIDVNGVIQWVAVGIYETGKLAGQLATVVSPTVEQLSKLGL